MNEKRIAVDFSNTPASKLTERIMLAVAPYLKDDAPGYYEAVYGHVKRIVLADMLVAKL